jgi:toxin-antitoxin system PIN domain toxin
MSYTVDANVLLYASDEQSPFHAAAVAFIQRVATGPEIVYLFWPTAMAYLRIATHPTVFARPLTHDEAIDNLRALFGLPHVQNPGEQDRFWSRFSEVSLDIRPVGNLVPDAHLVALMLENGVDRIWTHDRDYRKFRGITVRDPFADVMS